MLEKSLGCGAMRWRGLLLGIAAVVLFAGCGNDSAPSAAKVSTDSYAAEVRGAEEMIGDFVTGHEALKEAHRELDVASACVKAREIACARAHEDKNLSLQTRSKYLLALVNFGRYSRRANEAAKRKIEAKGLVGLGCHEDLHRAWHC
jgi:hypothetical protein